jgi:phenylacetic acid degradation operon negative regulatory protein
MASQRPQDLVFTLFGEYLLPRKGPIWVGSLIALLEPFGLSQGAVRTVLSRMTRKRWLQARRSGRNSFYRLTPRGRQLLEEGKVRIFQVTWDTPWNGSWFLLAYSIPEDRRHLRDRLRDRLAWLGFGSLGNGLWISPHDVHGEVEEAARELGIQDHLECFQGRRVSEIDTRELVAKCWDLPALNRKYHTFVDAWGPYLERGRLEAATGGMRANTCFALRFRLIHEFRRFPMEDPYLPRMLLPGDWAGDEASAVFHRLHDTLVGPADAYVDSVLESAPAPRRQAAAAPP